MAAADVAREQGAANLSLDAVAARAGVSKGGLLYHFPSKAALMRGSVEYFLAEFEARLSESTEKGTQSLLQAFVELTLQECDKPKPGAAGVLAAMAEDPHFLEPIKTFHRRLLDRLLADGERSHDALLAYLAVEGLRSLHLFEMDVLTAAERDEARASLLRLAGKLSA